eukprot:4123631-Alexandrium_andersonii.AAC.1
MAEGKMPSARPGGEDWSVEDGDRAALAGMQLAAPCCILYVKGDWSEYAASLGLPTWQDNRCPCLYCAQPAPLNVNVKGASPTSTGTWAVVDHKAYDD